MEPDEAKTEYLFGAPLSGGPAESAGTRKLHIGRLEGLIDWVGAWTHGRRGETVKGAWAEALTSASWVPAPAPGPEADPNARIRIEIKA